MENKIIAARYLPEDRELEVSFSRGARLSCPIDTLEMLTWTGTKFIKAPHPTDAQFANGQVDMQSIFLT